MTTNATSPVEEVAYCRSVVEYHDPVESDGAPFRPGDTLDGRFRITEVLSRSGMGRIFKAEDTHKMNEQQYPRLQLRTVKDLTEGKGIERPSNVAAVDETFKKAPESKKKQGQQKEFGL